MAEEWHAPRERLSEATISRHQAIRSLMEELEAVDWYAQRADDCADEALKAILLHNMREEIEHATMLLEWLRRNDRDFSGTLDAFLYSRGDITEVEKSVEDSDGRPAQTSSPPGEPPRFTIGPLK